MTSRKKRILTGKRGRALLALFCLLFSLLLPVPVARAEEEPEPDVRIQSRADFRRFAADCALDTWSEGLTVSLEADLDFGREDIEPVPSFSGTFLGNNHLISGLTLSTDGSNQALFRYVTAKAVIRDLNVEGTVAPTYGRDYVGGLAGTSWGSIENCSFSGRVSGRNYVGGLVGDNHGSILSCSFSGTVEGKRFTGGIAGYSEGLLRDCSSSGEVNVSVSEEKLELADLATSSNSLALSLLSAENENITSDTGGVVGFSKGVVLNCSNSGTVGYPHYGYNVGGIAGRQSGHLSGCRNTGHVYGKKDVAGIVGQMEPHLKLVETASLADELLLLNKYMNNASADIAALAEDFRDMQADIEAEREAAKQPVHEGGEIYHADEEIPSESGGSEGGSGSGGTITPADDSGSGSGDSGSGSSGSIESAIDSAAGHIESATDGAVTKADIESALRRGMDQLSYRLADAYDAFSESGGALAYDLNMANNQFSKVMLMMANAMNGSPQNDVFRDVSEELGETVSEGNVAGNENRGIVEGDNNVGGIAGSMGIEYEFDLEDALVQMVGANGIINNTYESACINSGNVNYGDVTGKKDRIGGIVGSEESGTVIHCESYGPTESTEGSYVGGIAGYSDTTIRGSYVLASLNGTRYVGGIAGSARDLYDNTSIIDIPTRGAFVGAVAGWADMTLGENVKGNYFVHASLGGVDGISYAGRAEPVEYDSLVTRNGTPDAFRAVTVRFVADGEQVAELTVDYGGSLSPEDIPAVPRKAGYSGSWADFETGNIRFSREVEAVYTLNRSTVASEETREDSPQSVVLLEGSFTEGAALSLTPYTGNGPALQEGFTAEAWEVTVENAEEDGSYTVRYLVDPDANPGETVIYVLQDGAWQQVEAEQSGSYLVFPANGNPVIFSAASPTAGKSAFPVLPVAAAGGGALLALLLLLAGRSRRKKRKTQAQPAATGDNPGDRAGS